MSLSTRDLKRRMRSVRNTGQLTRAMEAVAATKMRKAQAVALLTRPYGRKVVEVLGRLLEGGPLEHWLVEPRSVERLALVLITSDKGLCGVLNYNVLGQLERFLEAHRSLLAEGRCHFIPVGLYGARYLKRRGYPIAQEFSGVGQTARLADVEPLANFLLERYRAGQYDAVFAVYTDFVSTLKQAAVLRKILPLAPGALAAAVEGIPRKEASPALSEPPVAAGPYRYEYRFEPSPREVLEMLLPALFRTRLYQIILEANASEHSARMVAMKNASENAAELLDHLRLSLNKARQSGITREIAEITAGAAALEI